MARLFAPYVGNKPAPVEINGHRLLIVSAEKDFLRDNLQAIGGDRVKTLPANQTKEAQEQMLVELAQRSEAGIVMAPTEVGLPELLQSLRSELPWVH